jgi:hypothetical protein
MSEDDPKIGFFVWFIVTTHDLLRRDVYNILYGGIELILDMVNF